jgi:hypothetical protein
MLADAQNLGDNGTSVPGSFDPDWLEEFKGVIHGLILITGDSHTTLDTKLSEIKDMFSVEKDGATIHEVFTVVGDVRPDAELGHEQSVLPPHGIH